MPEGYAFTGVVLTDQMRSVSWSGRRAEFLIEAPPVVVNDVRAKIAALLDID
jgi:hypothetical protein